MWAQGIELKLLDLVASALYPLNQLTGPSLPHFLRWAVLRWVVSLILELTDWSGWLASKPYYSPFSAS